MASPQHVPLMELTVSKPGVFAKFKDMPEKQANKSNWWCTLEDLLNFLALETFSVYCTNLLNITNVLS